MNCQTAVAAHHHLLMISFLNERCYIIIDANEHTHCLGDIDDKLLQHHQ